MYNIINIFCVDESIMNKINHYIDIKQLKIPDTYFYKDEYIRKSQMVNVVLENKPIVPANPIAGSVFWDTLYNCLMIYDGTVWINYNPLDAYAFGVATDRLTGTKKQNSGTAPEIVNVKLIDPADFDVAGAAAQVGAEAKAYAMTIFNNLIGNAPAALDTIHELAAAVKANQDLINGLQAIANSRAKKVKISNPALTQSGGICTWNCSHGLTLSDSAVLCDLYTLSGEKVIADITTNGTTGVIIKIGSTTNISAGSYYAVIVR